MDEIFGINKEYERSIESLAALIHPDDRPSTLGHFKDEVPRVPTENASAA